MSEPGFEHWRSMLLDPGRAVWKQWEHGWGGRQLLADLGNSRVCRRMGVGVHDVVGWGDREQIREPNTRVPNTCDQPLGLIPP